jgi:hypothetical protein
VVQRAAVSSSFPSSPPKVLSQRQKPVLKSTLHPFYPNLHHP